MDKQVGQYGKQVLFLASIIAISAIVVLSIFSGSVAANHGGDHHLSDGDLVYQGQGPLFVNVSDTEADNSLRLVRTGSDGDVVVTQLAQRGSAGGYYVQLDTSNRETNNYEVRTGSSNTIVEFSIIEQELSFEINNEPDNITVDNHGDNAAVDFTGESNRIKFDLNVSADGLEVDKLEQIFDAHPGTISNNTEEGQITLEGYEADDNSVTLNFTGIDPGKYEFSFEAVDTTATDSISVAVSPGVEATDLIYSFEVENNGETYTVGIPGATNGTLADMIDQTKPGYTIFTFSDGNWKPVNDFSSVELSGLDAITIATEGDQSQPDSFTFQIEFASNQIPPAKHLSEGWNFVAAPKFADGDTVFGVDSSFLVVDPFKSPDSIQVQQVDQFGSHYIGQDTNRVSPFRGYFVFVENDTTLPGVLSGVETRGEINDQLGVDLFA